ncbi:hypothetical protein VC83_06536 [Pseudogymnoascus destructans]|uniref:EKC/KEOPS complex subunit CGI121 n=2 Tax=Pseudogymnoascus destructans TaxID=655981 RepID=L8FXW6_PSED2|nr:uncharacterized protein VC83_06536 [Pseudogymnoascus destructans]ELR05343.1 hypothetical protein GMDG_07326 [Pseudogymnoascus destructans 20631-21]OAF58317.1 hypothetical protein VC83_06536 [Pseudogymnoascus destructans]
MSLTTIAIDHLPPGHDVHIALFHSITNAAFLHAQLLASNTDFEYALVDAGVIVSKVQILAAAFRAINDNLEGRLRTRNVHSEMVFCLSPNNNIAESFRRFGVSPTTTSLIAIKTTTPSSPSSLTPASIQAHLASAVEGKQVPFSDEELGMVTDWARVRKVYKLPLVGQQGKKKGMGEEEKREEEERERREVGVQVLGAMALRGAS